MQRSTTHQKLVEGLLCRYRLDRAISTLRLLDLVGLEFSCHVCRRRERRVVFLRAVERRRDHEEVAIGQFTRREDALEHRRGRCGRRGKERGGDEKPDDEV